MPTALPSSPGRGDDLDVFEAELPRLRDAIAVTAPCRGELALSRRRQCADRAARPAGARARLHDPRHQRRPLSRARAAAAAGRRHLHPREGDDRHRRLSAQPQCRAAFEVAGRRWRGCSRAGRTRLRRRASSPTRSTSASTSCATNIRAKRVPEGRRPQQYLEHLTWEGAQRRWPEGIPDKVLTQLNHELRADREARLRALFPDRPRHRRLRAQPRPADPVPGTRIGGQQRGLLLPRHHRGRPGDQRPAVRALHFRGAQASRPTSTSISSTSGARK